MGKTTISPYKPSSYKDKEKFKTLLKELDSLKIDDLFNELNSSGFWSGLFKGEQSFSSLDNALRFLSAEELTAFCEVVNKLDLTQLYTLFLYSLYFSPSIIRNAASRGNASVFKILCDKLLSRLSPEQLLILCIPDNDNLISKDTLITFWKPPDKPIREVYNLICTEILSRFSAEQLSKLFSEKPFSTRGVKGSVVYVDILTAPSWYADVANLDENSLVLFCRHALSKLSGDQIFAAFQIEQLPANRGFSIALEVPAFYEILNKLKPEQFCYLMTMKSLLQLKSAFEVIISDQRRFKIFWDNKLSKLEPEHLFSILEKHRSYKYTAYCKSLFIDYFINHERIDLLLSIIDSLGLKRDPLVAKLILPYLLDSIEKINNDRAKNQLIISYISQCQGFITQYFGDSYNPDIIANFLKVVTAEGFPPIFTSFQLETIRQRYIFLKEKNSYMDVPLTPKLLIKIWRSFIGDLAAFLQKSKPAFFKGNGPSLQVTMEEMLKSMVKRKVPENQEISGDELLCLLIILNDFSRNQQLEEQIYLIPCENLKVKLFMTSTLHNTLPKNKVTQGQKFDASNFDEHFTVVKKSLADILDTTADVKRLCGYVLEFLLYIIKNENTVLDFFRKHQPEVFTVKEIPAVALHTDNVGAGDEKSFKIFLVNLIPNFLGAFYLARDAGRQKEFFERLSIGYCIEKRVGAVLEWATNLKKLLPFDTLVETILKEYKAYRRVMECLDIKADIEFIEPALNFILPRYENQLCEKHEKYAPTGKITKEGITDYLQNVLSYEKVPKDVNPSVAVNTNITKQ